MRFRTALVALLVTVPLAFGSTPPAQAQAADDLSTLAKMVPKVSKAKLKASVQYLAKKRKTTYEKELKAVISSIKKQVAYNKKRRSLAGALSVGQFQAAGGGEPARQASATGDIFVSTLGFQAAGINFGHAGIYYSTTKVLHAPGAGKVAQVQDLRFVPVGVGTVYMSTSVSVATQRDVAEYARSVYERQPYNYMYYTNKFPDGFTVTMPVTRGLSVNLNPADRANCSELVWGAYKAKAGVDLDGYTAGNGDYAAVFPWDIERSDQTISYNP